MTLPAKTQLLVRRRATLRITQDGVAKVLASNRPGTASASVSKYHVETAASTKASTSRTDRGSVCITQAPSVITEPENGTAEGRASLRRDGQAGAFAPRPLFSRVFRCHPILEVRRRLCAGGSSP